MANTILIIDDEVQLCISLSKLLKSKEYDILYTVDPGKVLPLLSENKIDLVITDLKMPEISGIDLIHKIRKVYSTLPIIMVSGYASVDNVVKAMRYGAINFFEKPVKFSDILKEIENLLPRVKGSVVPADENSQEAKAAVGTVSANKDMKEKITMLIKAAKTDVPILITGESGTGKELAASAIHYHSGRKSHPFMKINCAAIPDDLLESELFGYEKGAFTSADRSYSGKLEAAEGGTIFLDEIGEMSLKTQVKLLRVLQEKEYERLGSHTPRKMDVRILAATNRNLQNNIQEGKFRGELYYRLSVIHLELPPLRERSEDLLPLVRYFVSEFTSKYGKNIIKVDPEVESLFLQHSWPGNIRELRNTIERMVIFCEDDTLGLDVLPDHYRKKLSYEDIFPLRNASERISRVLILETLNKTGGNRSKTAEILGISRRTLYNKMKKLEIEI